MFQYKSCNKTRRNNHKKKCSGLSPRKGEYHNSDIYKVIWIFWYQFEYQLYHRYYSTNLLLSSQSNGVATQPLTLSQAIYKRIVWYCIILRIFAHLLRTLLAAILLFEFQSLKKEIIKILTTHLAYWKITSNQD